MVQVYAGNVVKSSDIPPGVWASYTPVWTSSGTAPAIVNGTIAGRYCQVGKLVTVLGRMATGSSSTYGTGNYSWSLPVVSAAVLGGNSIIGSCWIRDATGLDFQGQCLDGTTTFAVRPGASTFGGNAPAGQTAPMTWANGDWITWQLNYEAA